MFSILCIYVCVGPLVNFKPEEQSNTTGCEHLGGLGSGTSPWIAQASGASYRRHPCVCMFVWSIHNSYTDQPNRIRPSALFTLMWTLFVFMWVPVKALLSAFIWVISCVTACECLWKTFSALRWLDWRKGSCSSHIYWADTKVQWIQFHSTPGNLFLASSPNSCLM